jgi:malate synthase
VTLELVRSLMPQALARIRASLGDARFGAGRYDLAAKLYLELAANDEFADFLTIPCYDYLD